MKLIIGSIFLFLTFFFSTGKEDLKDPYPIWGKVYRSQQTDSLINREFRDTVFLENAKVFARVDSLIIAKTKTDKNGNYKLEFPVKYYEQNSIYIIAEHPDYTRGSLQTILYGYHFHENGLQCDFGLGKKK